jgi:2-methylcitrate synthase
MTIDTPALASKPKKSVALSGVTAGNTAICTVGRTGNDLHYRGYDILDMAAIAEFEEIAYLLVHGELPTRDELAAYHRKLATLRGIPVPVRSTSIGCAFAGTSSSASATITGNPRSRLSLAL